MTNFEPQKSSLKGISKRKPVGASPNSWVKTGHLLDQQESLPFVIQPAVEGVDVVNWAQNNRDLIETYLSQYGGVLFRGFHLSSVSEFEKFSNVFSQQLLEYTYRSTPRTREGGNIYTASEYPANQTILLHNEMAYTSSWPLKIWFFCVKAAEQGGETPIADSRVIYQRIDPAIRERFLQKGVMYVRNYFDELDLPWQTVFQTTKKAEVEAFCRETGIEFEWKSEHHLRTWQRCQAVAKHPKTDEMVWFNQAHLFHISGLPTEVREGLFAMCKEEDFPRNAYYGDGSPIETSILSEIREIYHQEMIVFPWQEGDILMLDNMLVAHGRRPFVGQRKILVGMAEPCYNAKI